MPKEGEIIYETRALRKQEEMGCKVEGLVVGRRRPLVDCARRKADHIQHAWLWTSSRLGCRMLGDFLSDGLSFSERLRKERPLMKGGKSRRVREFGKNGVFEGRR